MIFETPIDRAPHNVFFAFTPFNQFLLSALLERPEFTTSPALVVNTSIEKYLRDDTTVINLFDKNYSYWQLLWRYRGVADVLFTMRKEDRIASVTAPHPHNVLSNDLMLRDSDFPVNVYEDGIANYCASDNVGRLKKQSRLKAFIAPLLGCRYRDYAGHITGIDERVYQCGYFLSPGHIYSRSCFDSLGQIDVGMQGHRKSSQLQDCVLVLDQDIEKLFDAHVVRELRTRLVSFVKSLGVKIYIKSHPDQNRSKLTADFGDAAVLIESFKPAELLAVDMRPKYIVSFISSALKNVAGILPDVKCYSFGARELDKIRGTHLAKVFRDFEVNVL